ncbi:hypothetical protein E4U14_001291, partial [Claviceps sp. LM454 group G7]
CDNCWDYHARANCGREKRCRRCGQPGHHDLECRQPPQCANCLGTHMADDKTCTLRPM